MVVGGRVRWGGSLLCRVLWGVWGAGEFWGTMGVPAVLEGSLRQHRGPWDTGGGGGDLGYRGGPWGTVRVPRASRGSLKTHGVLGALWAPWGAVGPLGCCRGHWATMGVLRALGGSLGCCRVPGVL